MFHFFKSQHFRNKKILFKMTYNPNVLIYLFMNSFIQELLFLFIYFYNFSGVIVK